MMGGIALEKSEKARFSVTLTGLYVDRLNHLIEEGIFNNPGEIFRDSLRRTFRAYGLEPFTDKDRDAVKASEISRASVDTTDEKKVPEKKVPEDVASS